MKINTIYNEPCLDTLRKMPNDYLDCVITSPPYWQLRDYGYDGQWGLEPTFQEYLEHLWEMMDEIYRVLKPTGTVWINLGDTYNGSKTGNTSNKGYCENTVINTFKKEKISSIKNKCLLLIPHRFAIGCIERGWIVRNDIIWAKRNGMPESCTDRFSKKHEYFFFMVKSEKYYFNLDAVRDKIKDVSIERYKYNFTGQEGGNSNNFKGDKSHLIPKTKYQTIDIEATHRQGMHKNRGENIIEKRPNLPSQKEFVNFLRARVKMNVLIDSVEIPKTTIEHWYRNDEKGFSYPSIEHWNMIKDYLDSWDSEFEKIDAQMTEVVYETDDINKNINKGKNPGTISDFWDITTKPSSSKHYATYNDELIKKPILAGCPEGGLIYDPFMGTGSTAHASLRANRNYIGSEMSKSYIDIANNRLQPLKEQIKLL